MNGLKDREIRCETQLRRTTQQEEIEMGNRPEVVPVKLGAGDSRDVCERPRIARPSEIIQVVSRKVPLVRAPVRNQKEQRHCERYRGAPPVVHKRPFYRPQDRPTRKSKSQPWSACVT